MTAPPPLSPGAWSVAGRATAPTGDFLDSRRSAVYGAPLLSLDRRSAKADALDIGGSGPGPKGHASPPSRDRRLQQHEACTSAGGFSVAVPVSVRTACRSPRSGRTLQRGAFRPGPRIASSSENRRTGLGRAELAALSQTVGERYERNDTPRRGAARHSAGRRGRPERDGKTTRNPGGGWVDEAGGLVDTA